jgi:hypothetical protein
METVLPDALTPVKLLFDISKEPCATFMPPHPEKNDEGTVDGIGWAQSLFGWHCAVVEYVTSSGVKLAHVCPLSSERHHSEITDGELALPYGVTRKSVKCSENAFTNDGAKAAKIGALTVIVVARVPAT